MICPECEKKLEFLNWSINDTNMGTIDSDGYVDAWQDIAPETIYKCPECDHEFELADDDDAKECLNFDGTWEKYDDWRNRQPEGR